MTVGITPSTSPPGENHAAVDLGQIHQAAIVTNTGTALVVSGREIRSQKRFLAKQLGQIAKKRSKCTKGSRRWRKLGTAIAKLSLRSKRRILDTRHKGTHAVINFCKDEHVGSLYVGDPHGVRNNSCGRHHNQRMSQWEYGKDYDQLSPKSKKDRIECFNGTERGTSSHCPVCGHRHKPKNREWRCKKCGFTGHRDVVGGVNMHVIGFGENVPFPEKITYLRPGSGRSRTPGRVNNSRTVGRSSSPDAGQSCLAEIHAAGTGIARAPQGAAIGVGIRQEAHPL